MGREEGNMTAAFLLSDPPITSLGDYLDGGGGQGLARAIEIGPYQVIEEVSLSGLRGRGGAGFRTGTKWASVQRGGGRHYAVCNAGEGEPGTFKDRALMRANPYQVIEGLAIAALAVGAGEVFIALKASFETERARMKSAAEEMADAGLLDGLTLQLVAGPEEYLFGEEKALLEVIEGNDPLPRWLPPYLHGLFATAPQLGWEAHESEPGHETEHASNPTLVNNAETLANVSHILARGAEWFRSMGTQESPGTIVCTVVGDVVRAGVVEVELGTPLRAVLDHFGGARPGRTIRAVFSGVSNPVLGADDLDTALSYEAMEAIGSGLGAAGFIVYDDTACMVEVSRVLSRFLAVESCGQCPPCKFGTGEVTDALDRIATGRGDRLQLDRIHERLGIVADGNRCYLPVQEQRVVSSILTRFPEDVVAHLEGPCPRPRVIPIPKIVDITDGVVVYDERQARKRPDWTYAP
jgi:NADH:ubiquinone oxidoreductase subunit F (NADH-binding)